MVNMDKALSEISMRELAQQGKFKELLQTAEKLAQEYPNWHIAWHYVAVAHGLQGNHERAITNFIKALEIKPHSVKALYGLSVSFYSLKMYEQAISCLLKHLIDEAIEAFTEALTFQPESEETLYFLADCYRIQEKYETAIELFLRSLAINPQNKLVLHNTAVCYKYLNNNEKAILYYEKVLAIDPGFFRALRNISEIFIEIGETDKAHALIRKAAADYPDSKEIKDLHAKIFN